MVAQQNEPYRHKMRGPAGQLLESERVVMSGGRPGVGDHQAGRIAQANGGVFPRQFGEMAGRPPFAAMIEEREFMRLGSKRVLHAISESARQQPRIRVESARELLRLYYRGLFEISLRTSGIGSGTFGAPTRSREIGESVGSPARHAAMPRPLLGYAPPWW